MNVSVKFYCRQKLSKPVICRASALESQSKRREHTSCTQFSVWSNSLLNEHQPVYFAVNVRQTVIDDPQRKPKSDYFSIFTSFQDVSTKLSYSVIFSFDFCIFFSVMLIILALRVSNFFV